MSDFAKWRDEQFGPRRLCFRGSDDADLGKMMQAGLEAQAELRHRDIWDRITQGALYGWNAAPETSGNYSPEKSDE